MVKIRVWFNEKRQGRLLAAILILATLFRIFLFSRMPIDGLGDTLYDDLLLLQHGESMAGGNWLGDYGNLTLVKGIMFPAFIAFCNKFFIPYLLGMGLLYTAAAVSFVLAVRHFITNRYVQAAVYLFLLYSPSMLSGGTGQRAYNLALIPAAVLLTVSGLTGMFFRKDEKLRKFLPWSILAAAGTVFFWHLRDDSVWLLPFIAGASVITLIYALKKCEAWGKRVLRASVAILPVIALFASNLVISAVNYKEYGIFAVNDRSGTYFADFISDLLRIKADDAADTVWISQDAVNRALQVSPSLNEMKPQIEQMFSSGWASGGEINGDLIVWTLRDAAAQAGYYRDAVTANEYFRNVHEEISLAFKDGRLEKKDAVYLSNLSDGFVFSEDMPELLSFMAEDFRMLSGYEKSATGAYTGSGNWYQRRYIEAMTGANIVYNDVYMNIKGWIILKEDGKSKTITLTDENGNTVNTPSLQESADILEVYPEYDNSGVSRFQTDVRGEYRNGLFLNIYTDGSLLDTIPLVSGLTETDSYIVNVESAAALNDPELGYAKRIVSFSNKIVGLYKISGNLLTAAAVLSYIVLTVYMIYRMRRKEFYWWNIWLVITGLAGSCLVLIAAVSWFTEFLTKIQGTGHLYHYSTGALPVMEMIKILSVCSLGKIISEIRCSRKKHESLLRGQ